MKNRLLECCMCESTNQRAFIAEVGIRIPGLQNIDEPVVWVFPEVMICLDCGNAEFIVPETELSALAKDDATK